MFFLLAVRLWIQYKVAFPLSRLNAIESFPHEFPSPTHYPCWSKATGKSTLVAGICGLKNCDLHSTCVWFSYGDL
ncbi:hypothetical protein GALMADRAFT_220975 [Galerina marginata CBS 339.88]|uniref:Secreted protein n=1 Tax=Galerina marginata (strain CBS 339.88) TaxID=685588 RepID=A0A067TSX3_GALM3|nr:hypothetical protein GALMADRAFT_220975 [Galerina marginata CBS 339.88]